MKGSLSVCKLMLIWCIVKWYLQISQSRKRSGVEIIEQRKKRLNDTQPSS